MKMPLETSGFGDLETRGIAWDSYPVDIGGYFDFLPAK